MRLALVLVLLVAVAATADARFADAQGFSGRHGVTCVSCHFPEVVELGTPATVEVLGLPSSWNWSTSYALEVKVGGGPPGNPAPNTPQAGFDIDVDAGSFRAGEGMDDLVRLPSEQEATYTGVGTFVRSWNLVWTAPDLSGYPQNVTMWVAALAANGNHIMDGPDVTGERGDRAAVAIFHIPPSAEARAAWSERPLPPPVLAPYAPPVSRTTSVLTGSVPEFADGAEVRIDDGPWQGAIGSPGFSFVLPPWTPGTHILEARTVWNDRVSEPTSVRFDVAGGGDVAAASSNPAASPGLWVWLLLLLGIPSVPLLLRLRR